MKHYSSKEIKEAVGEMEKDVTKIGSHEAIMVGNSKYNEGYNQALQDLLNKLGIK